MGMYTEFFFRGELDRRTPEDVIHFLDRWFNKEHIQMTIPDHPFFTEDRWDSLLAGSSAYFPDVPTGGFEIDRFSRQWALAVHSSFKHYGNEIDQFLDWINPYISEPVGTFLGYSLYEEGNQPHLYFKR